MARKAVSMGWLPMISRARSNMSDLPRSTFGRLACSTARVTELSDDSVHQVPARWRRIEVLVFEANRLPLERSHLVERLHLHPLHVLHGRDKSCDTVDVRRIVGRAWHQREAGPDRLG